MSENRHDFFDWIRSIISIIGWFIGQLLLGVVVFLPFWLLFKGCA